jgi:hypothetical protein
LEKSFINNLTDEEIETLQLILMRCAAKISNFLNQHSEPKEYAEYMANHVDKKKNLVRVKLLAELPNMNSDEPYSHTGINKIISIDNINDSIISKVCTEFEDIKLLKNITTKKEIKDFKTKEFSTKGKKNTYKTAGRVSFYIKEPKIDQVVKILSKPEIGEYIIERLSKFDNNLVDKFLKFYYVSFIYLLKNHGNSLEFYAKSFSQFDKTIQLDLIPFSEYRNAMLSIPNEKIEKVAEKFVQALKKMLPSLL